MLTVPCGALLDTIAQWLALARAGEVSDGAREVDAAEGAGAGAGGGCAPAARAACAALDLEPDRAARCVPRPLSPVPSLSLTPSRARHCSPPLLFACMPCASTS